MTVSTTGRHPMAGDERLTIVMTVAYADPAWGGHEIALCRALARRGHAVTLVTSTMSPPRYGRVRFPAGASLDGDVRLIRLPAGPSPLESPLLLGMLRTLRALEADVYHAHESFQPATLWTALATRRTHRPLVVTQHTSGRFGRWWASPLYRAHLLLWGARVLRQASTVIALTSATAHHLRGLVPPERLRVVPSGVDGSLFTPDGPRDPAVAGLPRPVVLFTGRLAPNKDLPTLVQAMARLERGTLVLVGTGPSETDIIALSRTLLGPERVVFLGRIPHERLPAVYRSADVFVLPSRVEPFGLVLLEAMACGTPAIAAVAEGPSSVLPSDALFSPGDVDGLVTRLETVLADPERHRARALSIAADYTWDHIAERVEAIYLDAHAVPRAERPRR